MFLQIMQGKVRDADLFQQQGDKWRSDIKPGAIGYLGSTSGVSPRRHARSSGSVRISRSGAVPIVRGRSKAQWWEEMAPAFDGEVTFIDCPTVDLIAGGGNRAGGLRPGHARARRQPAGDARHGRRDDRRAEGNASGCARRHRRVARRPSVHSRRCTSRPKPTRARRSKTMADDPQVDEWNKMLDGDMPFVDIIDPTYD